MAKNRMIIETITWADVCLPSPEASCQVGVARLVFMPKFAQPMAKAQVTYLSVSILQSVTTYNKSSYKQTSRMDLCINKNWYLLC
jgi:hypothetical protein